MKAYTDFILVAIIVASLVFILIAFLFPRRRWRQRHFEKKGRHILKKIRAFEGTHVEARIFGYLRKINPFVFEELILTCMEDCGFEAIRNRRYTGDGGIDGMVILNGQKYLIQCKRYRGYINKKHLQDFANLVNTQNDIKGGFFIHTGKTGGGIENSRVRGVKIISGHMLLSFILSKPNDNASIAKYLGMAS